MTVTDEQSDADVSRDEPEGDEAEGLNEPEVEDTFERTVLEGRRRMSRGWPALIATGLVGGIDVATGVMAMLVVEAKTGDKLLAGLAFSIGFIALTLARSELFTEDFLVPVGAVIARKSRFRSLMRLWWVTCAANLVGGWIFTYLVVTGFSEVKQPAIESGKHYIDLGIGWRAFSLALLGGAVITLMTWMQHSTENMGVKIVPAVTTGFLLAGLQLNHAIVNSMLIFAGAAHAPVAVRLPAVGGNCRVGRTGQHGRRRRVGDDAADTAGSSQGHGERAQSVARRRGGRTRAQAEP